MRRAYGAAALGIAAVVLGGCAHKNRSGVMGHAGGPDEFAVARRAPLVIPPDYSLLPPKPGAPRPQEADSSTQALQALFGGEARPSATEGALIDQAASSPTTPGIRSEVGASDTPVVDKGQTTRDILAAPVGSGQDATVTTVTTGPTPAATPTSAPAATTPQQ